MRRTLITFCFGLLALIAAPHSAVADCVGYATEADRIDTARRAYPLAAIGTVTSVEHFDRQATGGLPIDVYTITIDTIYQGDIPDKTIRVAAPLDSTITRTFVVGDDYFIAPRDARNHNWQPTNVARFAPYVEDACTPTIALKETTAGFREALATAFGVSGSLEPATHEVTAAARAVNAEGGGESTSLIVGGFVG
ncbi:MAG TPA: hypothetical protein VIW24_00860, partial [Aldersonia sp.]